MIDADNVVRLRSLSSYRPDHCGLAQRLRLELDALANIYAQDLAGYIVVAVDSKGAWTLAWRTLNEDRAGEATPLGQIALAGIGVGAITMQMLADRAAVNALERNDLVPSEDPT